MARQLRVRPAILFCLLACLAASSRGDIVILRDNTRIEGTVRTTGDTFEITTPDNKTVVVRHAEVERIERAGAAKPKEFEVSARLRWRVERHQRLNALGTALRRGGPGASRAARALAEAGADALPFLAAALAEDDDDVTDAALRALGSIGGRAAADSIAARLSKLKPALQITALDELGRMGAAYTIPAIHALLRAEKTHLKVRQAAVRSLGRLRNPFALPPLIAALARTGTASSASQALISLDSPAALPYLERLIEREAGPSGPAARVTANIAGPEHVQLLLRLRNSKEIGVRNAADLALARLKASKSARIATYIQLLGSANQREAAAAAGQLRKITKHDADDHKAWAAWWLKQNRARAQIVVIPVGPVDASLMRAVQSAAEKATGIETGLAARLTPPEWARVPGSKRYRADALLDQIERRVARSPQIIAAVAVTPTRIEMPGSGPVIGAFRYGSCGLVSLPGLEAGNDAALLASRLVRHTLHVLARSLRISTAGAADCPAGPVYEAAELDGLNDRFSDETAQNVAASVGVSVSLLAGDLDGAAAGLRALRGVADRRQWAIELAFLAERNLNLALARGFWQDAANASAGETERALIDARITLIDALAKPK
ncbi:MAG: HEAT repeat domain-containing protein [Planctomycetota bacterium]